MSIIYEVVIYLAVGSTYWWWSQNLTVFGLAPNLMFAAALCAAILAGPVKGIAWGFFLGFYADMLGSDMFGGYALTYTLMAYGVYIIKRHFDMDSLFSQLVASLALSWLSILFYQGLVISFSRPSNLDLRVFLSEPFLNALVVPVMFRIFYQLKRGLGVL
ncbi:MAG: rod shape-determining protein MreD [Elusimicrobia bacterium CG08_land_8_20_14_0_20_59_10]|nr:MAG: rod shape-determining protein MreD [Elusimicrobia bacterium CG08_land_8_20_14_0_20_59_10]